MGQGSGRGRGFDSRLHRLPFVRQFHSPPTKSLAHDTPPHVDFIYL